MLFNYELQLHKVFKGKYYEYVMTEIIKEIEKEEKHFAKTFSKRENIFILISIILAIALLASLILPLGTSKNKTGENLVSFLNANVVSDGGVTLKDVEDKGDLYLVNVLYKGQEIPVYTTKDGRYFIQGVTDMQNFDSPASSADAPAQKEIPKSDRPKVDLWVFSYCPFGTQAEKGLIPAYNLLKNKADINIKFIGAMHGEYEKTESLRQLCVQKLYGQDKFMDYILKFNLNSSIGSCSSNTACSKPIADSIMKSLGIDTSKIDSCMASDGLALYAAQEEEAASLGIQGSPTLVINDVESSAMATQPGRSPASVLFAICATFNNAPSECSQNLSSAYYAPGFGTSTSAGDASSNSGASCG